MKPISIILFLIALTTSALAQQRKPFTSWEEVAEAVKNDTTKPKPRPKTKPYNEVITKEFRTQSGLFTVHRAHDTVYFEIPDSLLHRDLMVINRLGKGPGGTGQYAGEELDQKTIFFEKGVDSSLIIRYDLVISEADSTSEIFKAVVRSNLNPMVATFPIITYGKDHRSYVIDVTKFLKEKTFVNSINGGTQLAKNLNTGVLKDVYVGYVHTYPINVEINIPKNVETKPANGGGAEPASIETH